MIELICFVGGSIYIHSLLGYRPEANLRGTTPFHNHQWLLHSGSLGLSKEKIKKRRAEPQSTLHQLSSWIGWLRLVWVGMETNNFSSKMTPIKPTKRRRPGRLRNASPIFKKRRTWSSRCIWWNKNNTWTWLKRSKLNESMKVEWSWMNWKGNL